MADSYGKHFGFRISDEGLRLANGRLKTPVGSTWHQGQLVTPDYANPGFLKLAADASGPAGTVGLVIQENQGDNSIYGPVLLTDERLAQVRPGQRAVMTSGAGVKVWVKNIADSGVRADGHDVPGITMWSGLTAGCHVGWDGTKYIAVTDLSLSIGTCEELSGVRAEILLSK